MQVSNVIGQGARTSLVGTGRFGRLARRSGLLAGMLFTTAIASNASATLIFGTGFEASETPSYTSGTQLATVAGWSGSGQDTTGWAISTATVGGSGAETGSQYVLASSPTASVLTRFQWQDQPVTDFSVEPVLTGSIGVKLMSPTTGTVNRSTLAGIQLYDAAVNLDAALYVFNDIQNLETGAAPAWYILQDFQDGSGYLYTLTGAPVNQYFDLSIQVDYSTGVVSGFVNGTELPQTGTTTATDFHDLDMVVGRAATTTGGTANRAGFDNYSVSTSAEVPEPATIGLGMLSLGGLGLARRRKA